MNKWRIAFWFCLATLITVVAIAIYIIISQATTLTYMKEGYIATDNDLTSLTEIIDETDLTKEQIKNLLVKHKLVEYMDFNSDTVPLHRITLLFKDNQLNQITKQW